MDIGHSVGSGGVNEVSDVFCVQMLINVWKNSIKQPEIAEDGRVGPATIKAISDFQKKTGWVDGRVDPGGRAHRALQEIAGPKVNEALAFIIVGISTTHAPTGYEVEMPPALSERNLLSIYSFRQSRRR